MLAHQWNVPFIEVSAKDNVDSLFIYMLRAILKKNRTQAAAPLLFPTGRLALTVKPAERISVNGDSLENATNSTWDQDVLSLVNEPSSSDIQIFLEHRTPFHHSPKQHCLFLHLHIRGHRIWADFCTQTHPRKALH